MGGTLGWGVHIFQNWLHLCLISKESPNEVKGLLPTLARALRVFQTKNFFSDCLLERALVAAVSGAYFNPGQPSGIMWASNCDFQVTWRHRTTKHSRRGLRPGLSEQHRMLSFRSQQRDWRCICFLKRRYGLSQNDAITAGSDYVATCGIDCSPGSLGRFGTQC